MCEACRQTRKRAGVQAYSLPGGYRGVRAPSCTVATRELHDSCTLCELHGTKHGLHATQCPLARSLLGVKRTCHVAPHMSACDPKRTASGTFKCASLSR